MKYLLALGALTLLSLTFAGDPEAELRKPENAVKNLVVADGLAVQLFASEPVLTNPTTRRLNNLCRIRLIAEEASLVDAFLALQIFKNYIVWRVTNNKMETLNIC